VNTHQPGAASARLLRLILQPAAELRQNFAPALPARAGELVGHNSECRKRKTRLRSSPARSQPAAIFTPQEP
jgi:hypothetical protein